MNSPPASDAQKKRVFKVAKIEPPAAPVAPKKMSVSKAEAVKQIKAYKEKEAKVSSMATKVKERKALRLLKALVVARRAKKASAPHITPTAIFTSLWEGEPAEKNSIRFKSAASNADIIKAIRDSYNAYNPDSPTSLEFTITSSKGSKLITPQGSSYQQEQSFKTKFNKKGFLAYYDPDGDKYNEINVDVYKPRAGASPKVVEKVKESLKKASTQVFQKDSGGEDSERTYSFVFDKPEGYSADEVQAAMFELIHEHHETLQERDGQWEYEFGADTKDVNKYLKEYVNPPAAAEATPMKPKNTREINKAKKLSVMNAVIEASMNAQKVYDENKDKKDFFTGKIGYFERQMIGKAEEKIRSARLSEGGGTLISLTDKEFERIVKKFYPRYFSN